VCFYATYWQASIEDLSWDFNVYLYASYYCDYRLLRRRSTNIKETHNDTTYRSFDFERLKCVGCQVIKFERTRTIRGGVIAIYVPIWAPSTTLRLYGFVYFTVLNYSG